jgi:hypothetical protein
MSRARAPILLLSVIAAGAALAGCGGSASTSGSARPSTLSGSGTGTPPLTNEEMREYDANEGRCHDDGGSVRNVGSLDAYCAFPNHSNDFHLIESSQGRIPSGAEE